MLNVEHRRTTDAETEAEGARAASIARCLEPLLRSARRLSAETGGVLAEIAARHLESALSMLRDLSQVEPPHPGHARGCADDCGDAREGQT